MFNSATLMVMLPFILFAIVAIVVAVVIFKTMSGGGGSGIMARWITDNVSCRPEQRQSAFKITIQLGYKTIV